MKCVGSQYIEAVRKHFLAGKTQWRRTIHLVYGSEEENGSAEGMAAFVKTQEFKDLNVGFWLDEGQASETAVYKVFYAEKNQWWIKVKCQGSPGHGSKFVENTAGEKLLSVIQSALKFRDEQQKIHKTEKKSLGEVITLNLTKVEGGTAINVLPLELTACKLNNVN
ncbi:hypothetical protein TELCIR_07345 [Teladorsagia circumcincta]|uniref:Peptidase M20 dimerisation domain-containing protein n=1 Tax=Teladorsagia circumcincta TaxID=45464 RepID=A0A2G9UKN4_TELCI|nr:hypothetical protein TELCIR_07345 [Teladorsagia circumcincta]